MAKYIEHIERVIKTYEFEGETLGKIYEVPYYGSPAKPFGKVIVKRVKEFRFEPEINEFSIIDLLQDLSPSERMHLKTSANTIYQLFKHININPNTYLSDEDIMIHVADRGYKNLTELNRQDHKAWKLVKERGLEERLFSGLLSTK